MDVFGLLNVAKPVLLSKKAQPKAHVLVCAPSNSALDEIVIRLLDSGIIDRCARNVYLSGFFAKKRQLLH